MNERDLFIAVLEKATGAERRAYLEEACNGDAALRQRVEALLEVHGRAGNFLETSPAGAVATVAGAAVEGPGTMIDSFKLLEQLGEGGMGTVFLAEQTEPVQRRVALKIIKPGMDSEQIIARFEQERQALAQMDHPNIAKVLDAGTTATGRPYFVMELVKGVPLTRYCDGRHLTPRQRLELFVSVCQAIQHAHQKGIIHRDVKPSNVLVAEYDGKPVPKVIDFGVAKAAGQQLTEKTLVTGLGTIVGTLEYMSPEQAEPNQLDVDTCSDIYSLGVLLYELLTGTTPLERKRLKEVAFLEVLRLIREEESPRPSTRLSTTERLPSIATDRGVEPKKLSGLMRGELDWIAMKALEKDRTRRYETASAFAADVQRYLQDEPVEAGPPSRWYRFRKFARRHKKSATVVAFAVLAFLSLVAALLFHLDARAADAAKIADAARERELNATRQAEAARRQLAVLEAQRLRMSSPHRPRWSRDVWEFLRKAALIARDDNLRDQAATSLIGLDVVPAKEFQGSGASSLAFDAAGAKLLMGAHAQGQGNGGKEFSAQPIRIWDRATDRVRRTQIFRPGPVTFDAKDRPLALTGDKDPSILVLWELDKEQPLRKFALPAKVKGQLQQLALSTNGAKVAALVALPADKSLVVAWDAATGKILRAEEQKTSNALALSPDGTLLAVGDRDGRIQVWSFEKAAPIASLKTGRLAVSALAFGRNPRKAPEEKPWVLAAGDKGGTISIWDLADQLPRARCPGSHHDIYALAFSHDGTRLASGGRGWPRMWNPITGQLVLELDYQDFVAAMAFSPAGTHLAVGNPRGPFSWVHVRVWELESGRGLQTLDGLSGQIAHVEFSHDGKHLAALSHLWEIAVWDLTAGRLLHVFPAPPGYLIDNAAIALSGDNRYLAFTSGTNAVMWDLQTGKSQPWPLPPGMVDRVAFHSGLGKFLSFRMETLTGKEWPFATKADFRHHPRVGRLREWSPSGIKEIGVIEDFNKNVLAATLARNASVVVVDGLRVDEKGETRLVRAYSLPGAKEIWRDPGGIKKVGGWQLLLTPDGRFHLYWAFEGDRAIRPRLLEFATGKTEDWQIIASSLGPEGNFAVLRVQEERTGRAAGLQVHRRGAKTPLVVFATNSSAIQFNLAGTQFAWGTNDGSVIVCDLAEAQKRLAGIGLGW